MSSPKSSTPLTLIDLLSRSCLLLPGSAILSTARGDVPDAEKTGDVHEGGMMAEHDGRYDVIDYEDGTFGVYRDTTDPATSVHVATCGSERIAREVAEVMNMAAELSSSPLIGSGSGRAGVIRRAQMRDRMSRIAVEVDDARGCDMTGCGAPEPRVCDGPDVIKVVLVPVVRSMSQTRRRSHHAS